MAGPDRSAAEHTPACNRSGPAYGRRARPRARRPLLRPSAEGPQAPIWSPNLKPVRRDSPPGRACGTPHGRTAAPLRPTMPAGGTDRLASQHAARPVRPITTLLRWSGRHGLNGGHAPGIPFLQYLHHDWKNGGLVQFDKDCKWVGSKWVGGEWNGIHSLIPSKRISAVWYSVLLYEDNPFSSGPRRIKCGDKKP